LVKFCEKKARSKLSRWSITKKGKITGTDTGEPHLSFNDFIALLKKNKKKLKIDRVARKQQETLEKEYEVSLDRLQPMKRELMRCDKLIIGFFMNSID